jgi:lysophospholipase L1-like esterase
MAIQQFMIRYRVAVAVIAVASVLMVAIAFLSNSNSAVTPEPRDSEFWGNRFEEINRRVYQDNVDLLFVGDSITHFWEGTIYPVGGDPHPATGQAVWNEYYSHRKAANIGIGDDRTENLLWRLNNGNVDGISPKLIVLLIGTNNWRSNTAPEISDGIVAVVDSLLTKLPESNVLLLGIFPRGERPNEIRAMMSEANALTATRVASNSRVTYLDIGKEFLTDDGLLPIDVMPDSLHPSPEGYRIWAEAIEPMVSEFLED